jgi:holo-[acyl-carrier protein] synthase
MIVSVGTDLVDLDRLRRAVDRSAGRILDRLLTETERAYCQRSRDPLPSIAARFAAKEAIMKCLGTGWGHGVGWRDIEVINSERGEPSARLSGGAAARAHELGIATIHLSLSHTHQHALAMAVATAAS